MLRCAIQVHFKSLLDRTMYLDPEERDSVTEMLQDINTWATEY